MDEVRHEFDEDPIASSELAPWRAVPATKRFLLYSHDSRGLGPLRRSLTLATGLVEAFPEAEVLLITGSSCAMLFPIPARVGLVKLPSAGKGASDDLVPPVQDGPIAAALERRRNLVLEAYRSFRPTLVLVDHEVIGMHGELYEMLQRARADGVRTVLGIRDIVDSPAVVAAEWGNDRCRWALTAGYDRVCVYGAPEVFDPRVEYALPPELRERVEFTGYVVRPVPVARTRPGTCRPRVLVTLGGGENAARTLATVLEGLERNRPAWDCVLVGGPLLDERDSRRLRRRADALGGVQVSRFEADLPALLAGSNAVVATAGYNTCAEILQGKKPAILLPHMRPRMEQTLRAERFQALGLVRNLVDPRPAEIVAAVERALAEGPPSAENLPGLDGVARVCAVVRELVGAPTPSAAPAQRLSAASLPAAR